MNTPEHQNDPHALIREAFYDALGVAADKRERESNLGEGFIKEITHISQRGPEPAVYKFGLGTSALSSGLMILSEEYESAEEIKRTLHVRLCYTELHSKKLEEMFECFKKTRDISRTSKISNWKRFPGISITRSNGKLGILGRDNVKLRGQYPHQTELLFELAKPRGSKSFDTQSIEIVLTELAEYFFRSTLAVQGHLGFTSGNLLKNEEQYPIGEPLFAWDENKKIPRPHDIVNTLSWNSGTFHLPEASEVIRRIQDGVKSSTFEISNPEKSLEKKIENATPYWVGYHILNFHEPHRVHFEIQTCNRGLSPLHIVGGSLDPVSQSRRLYHFIFETDRTNTSKLIEVEAILRNRLIQSISHQVDFKIHTEKNSSTLLLNRGLRIPIDKASVSNIAITCSVDSKSVFLLQDIIYSVVLAHHQAGFSLSGDSFGILKRGVTPMEK